MVRRNSECGGPEARARRCQTDLTGVRSAPSLGAPSSQEPCAWFKALLLLT